MSLFSHEFTGRAPSVTQIEKAIKRALAQGASFITLSWGENEITIEREEFRFYGSGWIRRHSGIDLARELTIRHVPTGATNWGN